MELVAQVAAVINEYFGSHHSIDRGTIASDIDGWDSLAHATLLITIEKRFGVRFALERVWGLTNVGELVDYVAELRGECRV